MRLPELPETHDWLCNCCNAVRTTILCPESEEIVGVHAWERGVKPVYEAGSTFDGHSPDIEYLEKEANAMCVDPDPLIRFEVCSVNGMTGVLV